MKNFIRRLIILLVFLWFVWWLTYLFIFSNNKITNLDTKEYLIFAIYLLICLYYIIFYAVKPTYFKWYKLLNTIIWLVVIFISQKYVLNSWNEAIYYWDIFSIIWVVLTFVWPTNIFLPKEIKKEKKLEIIEIE